MTGVQALVRVLLDQHRADARDGLRTSTLVSGYPGSARFDKEAAGLGPLAAAHDVALWPAVNEGSARVVARPRRIRSVTGMVSR